MKKIFILLAFSGLCFAAYAGDDIGAMRLHDTGKCYDSVTGGKDDFVRPLKAVSLKFESPIVRVGKYKNGKAFLQTMSTAEARRVEALRRKLIEAYVREDASCRIDPKAQWELIVACDPDVGLTDDKESLKDLPSSEGITMGSRPLTYPVVRGWYCLVDKKTNTAVIDKEVTGSGSAIDTALDDFAKKLILDFADNIKEK